MLVSARRCNGAHGGCLRVTQEFCQKQPQHCGVVGRGAVAAHYSYYTQRSGLGTQTDVLKQYRDIAMSVCGDLVRCLIAAPS